MHIKFLPQSLNFTLLYLFLDRLNIRECAAGNFVLLQLPKIPKKSEPLQHRAEVVFQLCRGTIIRVRLVLHFFTF